jgi:hypothetical protein
MASKTIHVRPTKDGAWTVAARTGRAGKVFSTQAEAIKAAQSSVREAGGELFVHATQGPAKKSFTLGRTAMAKLNAVEGVALTPAAKAAFKAFDRQDLSPARRREALRNDLPKLAATPKAKATGGPSERVTKKA